ncbi:hypothetical protein [Pseudomonas fluorescens]|nr:hypothetical protein [Pseudomonas fluorescens]
MRMAHYNGFGTVRNMCAYFAFKPRRLIDVLDQSSPLLKIVDKEAPLLAENLRKVFYTVAANSWHFTKAGDISLLRGACPNDFYYCPQCIEASQSPIFHDIRKIGVCLLHGTKLITACPNCRITECWYNAQLFQCRCNFERRAANRVVANFISCVFDPFQSPLDIEDIRYKHAIAKVCVSLWDARRDAGNHKSCDLPLQIIEHIDMIVAAQVARYPGFIKTLHRAPWINYGSASVAWIADRALERFCTDGQSCPNDCCRLATIDRNNAERAMFDDKQSSAEVVRNCIRGWREQQSEYLYTVPPRCEIIRRVNAKYSSDVEQRSVNSDGLTEDEVAALLKCPLSAVDGLLKYGWLKHLETTVPYQSLLPKVLDRPSTEQFAKQYILLHELCEAFDLPDYLLANLIDAARIQTNCRFSGPRFFPRATTYGLLSQLQNHGLLSRADVQRSAAPIAPDMLEELQYELMQIDAFKKDQSEQIPDQKPKYFCFAKKSPSLDRDN